MKGYPPHPPPLVGCKVRLHSRNSSLKQRHTKWSFLERAIRRIQRPKVLFLLGLVVIKEIKKKALPAATISGICDLLIKQLLVSFPKGASPARPQEIRSIPGFSTEIAILVKTQGW